MSTTYNETRVNLRLHSLKDGKAVYEDKVSVEEEKATEIIAEEKAEGRDSEILVAQSFTFHQVSDNDPLNDLATMVADVGEQANLINRAIILKQQQHVRKLLVSKDFTPVDGAYDLLPVIGAVSERQTAAPDVKAANALSKLLGRQVSLDELNQIVASLGSASA